MSGFVFWLNVWAHSAKAALLLGVTLVFLSIPAGLFLPLPVGDRPLISIGAWFVALAVAVVAFCSWSYEVRSRALGRREEAPVFLDEMLSSLLGVLGAGPFAVLLLSIAREKPEASSHNAVLGTGVVAAVLAAWSAASLFRLLRPRRG